MWGNASNRHPFWRKRDKGTGSVIQSLFTRELGLPEYTVRAEPVSSSHNERRIYRQLALARTSEDAQRAPECMSLRSTDNLHELSTERLESPHDFDRFAVGWIQVELERARELSYVDGVFWEKQAHIRMWEEPENSERNQDNVDTFFILPPDFMEGFKKLGQMDYTHSAALVGYAYLNEGPCLTHVRKVHSSFLVTLLSNGCVRLYDMAHGRSTELILYNARTGRFNQVVVNTDTEEIYVITTRKKITKTIYVLKYMNDTNQLRVNSVFHVKFKAAVEIYEDLVRISTHEFMDISSWDLMITNAESTGEKISENQYLHTECSNGFEQIVKRMPLPLKRLYIRDIHQLTIVTTLWPPHFRVEHKIDGIDLTKIGNLGTLEIIWKHACKADTMEKIDFNDASSRFLFGDGEQYLTMSLKPNEEGCIEVVKESADWLFAKPDNGRQPKTSEETKTLKSVPSSSFKGTFQRGKSPRMDVYQIEYCSDLDLIAVCSLAKGVVQICLYDATGLTLFKTLPPLFPWIDPRNKNCGKILIGLTMSFANNLISVDIEYDHCEHDFFFYQLL